MQYDTQKTDKISNMDRPVMQTTQMCLTTCPSDGLASSLQEFSYMSPAGFR